MIDEANGNTLWRDAITKEMADIRVAFKILPDGSREPVAHQYMECHLIFEIKLDGFHRKARLVAGGHMTEAPAVMTYASVMSRETVRITLMTTVLNDLEVKASDVQNAYLTTPCVEKIYTKLGPEFGADKDKVVIIVHALYGLKSAGASFGRHISDCMRTCVLMHVRVTLTCGTSQQHDWTMGSSIMNMCCCMWMIVLLSHMMPCLF